MKSVRQYKSRAILTPVVMVVEAAMEILIPFVMTLLVGVIEGAQEEGRNLVQEDFVQIAIYGGIMFVLGLGRLQAAFWAASSLPRRARASLPTSGRTRTIRSRPFRSPISTAFRRLRSSPV